MTRRFALGEPAPWFHAQALGGNPRFAFDTTAGRWIAMLFLADAGPAERQAALDLVQRERDLFDDHHACFFGITVDPADAENGRIAQQLPGIRWFLDYDRAVSTAYGAFPPDGSAAGTPFWLVLDPAMCVRAQAPLSAGAEVLRQLRAIAGIKRSIPAPVLIVPDVLLPETCRQLIDLYDRHGGEESGFMREVDGVTRKLTDPSHKRRSDYAITDADLIAALKGRIVLVLRPMIRRAFQFEATRIERWIVARYDAEGGGYFRPHRDNTTKGTAHRKFAVTINLDTSRYEGGDLCFPEFGDQTYRAPTGGAVVFSCSLLHEARPVTSGSRYAFLPFLYDDEGARLRERNLPHVEPELQGYRSGLTQEP
jgi:hypothetical protein